jgi:hypothetical protein
MTYEGADTALVLPAGEDEDDGDIVLGDVMGAAARR